MDLRRVKEIVGSTPNMTLERAERIRSLLEGTEGANVLELGFAHGVGTCYLAAMVEPTGSVTAIDLHRAREREPAAEELLSRTGLESVVELIHEPTSYTWRLLRMLEDGVGARFDLVYLDGAHNWTVDGLAFYLSDKLLRPGGWLVLDDLTWTYATSSIANEPWVQQMGEDEQTEPHVRKIWDHLIVTHAGYGGFVEDGDLGIAQKLTAEATCAVRTVMVRPTLRQLVEMTRVSLRERIRRGRRRQP